MITFPFQIVQTVARDADEGKNAKISYHMPEEFATHFDLDEETGWIKTRQEFFFVCGQWPTDLVIT